MRNIEQVYFLAPPDKYTCHLCGKQTDIDEQIPGSIYLPLMLRENLCLSCAYWTDKINHPPVGMEIVDGYCLIVNPYVRRPDNLIKGGRGKELYLIKPDGTLIKSNNVWNQGKIPDRFRKQLPDTASNLRMLDYQRLKRNPFRCSAKGCWDRYHCLRYDLSCEADGPFNQVPPNHKIGSEKCRSLIQPKPLKL